MIVIKTKNIMVRGEKRVEVIKINALTYSQLPSEYVRTGAGVKQENKHLLATDYLLAPKKHYYLLSEGDHYDPKYIEEVLVFIRQAGDRLQKINKKIKKEAEEWLGKETIYKI
jgi:hypothetical protein